MQVLADSLGGKRAPERARSDRLKIFCICRKLLCANPLCAESSRKRKEYLVKRAFISRREKSVGEKNEVLAAVRDRIEIFGDSLAHRLTAPVSRFPFRPPRESPKEARALQNKALSQKDRSCVWCISSPRLSTRQALLRGHLKDRSAQARARREKSLSLISALAAFVKVTASTSEGFTSESGEVRSRMSRAVRTAVFPEPAAADQKKIASAVLYRVKLRFCPCPCAAHLYLHLPSVFLQSIRSLQYLHGTPPS